MSLWPLKTVSPCLEYHQWDGVPHYPIRYNEWLITPPRIYDEAINSVGHFFYEPGGDLLVAYMIFDTYHWPSWACWRYEFSAETGAFIKRSQAGIISMAWACHAGMGSYNKTYTTMNSTTRIYEVPWDSLSPGAGMWSVDPYTWNPKTIFRYAVVNREDNLIAGVGSWTLEVWDISGIPVRRAQMRLPNVLGYLAYESRDNLWLITQDGLVAKANYRVNPPRWEMLSSVQNPSPDAKNYLVAFDTKRRRLAVFRQRPDAEDGSCQCQLEFYRPLYKVAGLTDPVPVSRLRAEEKVLFVAHLYGDNGEGVSPYTVNATLEEPVGGRLLTPFAGTELNGAASFRYQAPAASCTEKLKLSSTITDGEQDG